MSVASRRGESEVSILARVSDDERGLLPVELAHSVIDADFSERDADFSERDMARMHDPAVRNQADALSPEDKEELYAFA